MDPEELKKGDKVNLTLLVTDIVDFGGEKSITAELPTGRIFMIWQSDFEALSPANGTKNAEPAPKYDPCRKFRKGDKAELREEINGRKNPKLPEGIIFEVVGDEDDYGVVPIEYISVRGMLTSTSVMAIWLKLVQPVEEREPHSVHENECSKSMEVRRGNPVRVCAAYYYGGECPAYTKEAAKEAAEAECDRLNAEWRAAHNAELRKEAEQWLKK